MQRIKWIGHRRFGARALAQHENLRPICITAGALGQGLPTRDLIVSRQHRMLVSSRIARRVLGCSDVLLPAIRLTALPGVYVNHSCQQVAYFHMLFSRHEVIFAEDAPTESLYPGPQALDALSAASRQEVLTLFPQLQFLNYPPGAARPIPPVAAQKQMILRHAKNNKPLLETYRA